MKKQRGLGRGLDAIFGSELPGEQREVIKPMSDMSQVALSLITPNPSQPRRDFDPEGLEQLAQSISTLGLIQPITVKKNGGKYMIISGERRYRAAAMAGLESIAAYIRDVDDQALHSMALVENIQRKDLNPIEIALGLQRLIEECGITQERLSERVSMKRSTVSNFLRLLKLAEQVQLALKSGVITMGHAKVIAGLPLEQQVELLKRCMAHSLSVRQCEEQANRLLLTTEQSEQSEATQEEEEYPESYSRLVERLSGVFSQNISIKRRRNGGGRIVIEFKEDEQVEEFIKRLS